MNINQEDCGCGNVCILYNSTLSTAPCQKLRPFLPDRKSPQDQEFAVVCVREPCVFVRQWSDVMQCCHELSFSSTLSCRLLEYRNLTYRSVIQPVSLRGHATHTHTRSRRTLHCDTTLTPLHAAAGQYAVHTLDRALQAWTQVRRADHDRNNDVEQKCFKAAACYCSDSSWSYLDRSHTDPSNQ